MKSKNIALVLFLVVVTKAIPIWFTQQPGPTDKGLYLLSLNDDLVGLLGEGPTSYWNIAQWSNPSPITSTSVNYGQGPCSTPNSLWYTANDNSRICLASSSSANNYVELASSGVSNLQCGVEFDVFLQTNEGGVVPNVNLNIPYADVTARCGTFPQCSSSPDYGYLTMALVLGNGAGQTLFYQITLWDSRMNDNCGYGDPCKSAHSWFFSTNPYGVDDSIGAYSQPCLTPGSGRVAYELNVLPFLLATLSDNPPAGLDTNPAHWTIGSLYTGSGLQGNTVITAVVDSVSLIGMQ